MKIVPDNKCGSYRTGVLIDITVDEIAEALGFKANCIDDPDKVVNSWGFTIGDEYFGVWDYKGSHLLGCFSTFGDSAVLRELFGEHYHECR